MDMKLIQKARDHVREIFYKDVPEEYAYHNYNHTMNVVNAVEDLATEAEVSDDDREILLLAAYFHDIGFSKDPDNHEEYSQKLARQFLEKEAYQDDKLQKVLQCIEATKISWDGEDQLCCLVKDADLSGLASSEFDDITEKLRKEMSFREKSIIDDKSWIKNNIEFLKSHHYQTEAGKTLYNAGKEENLKKLEKLRKSQKKKKKKKKQEQLTIATSKSAQTQFKTALRNHIDLSSIADNKANIMLSVNAVIITVGLPLLIDRASIHPQLYVPTAILAFVCLISMIFATLSTRPIKTRGRTELENILNNNSNLFFFGNYYRMSLDDYEQSIREVIGNNEKLDSSIIRDLFYLGKSLGKKFDYLRWCYNFFMYGIAIAVLSYPLALLLSSR